MKNFKLFIPLLIFVVLGLFLLWGLGKDPSDMPSALIDRSVPEFALPDLQNPGMTLDQTLFQGQVTLLNVWGTWCPPCRIEHPFLVALEKQGVAIVGMNYKDVPEAAREWLIDKGDPYRATFEDREGRYGINLGVFGAPETYLVDHRGKIHYKHVGIVDEAVWQQIEPLYNKLVAASEEDRP